MNFGLIGNCTVSALVTSDGAIQWSCLPRMDSPPLFHALINDAQDSPAQGQWRIDLEGMTETRQHYVPNTAVLVTELRDSQGNGIAIHDFAPRFPWLERMFRPAQLVRRVFLLQGHPRIRISMRPVADWGRGRVEVSRGSHHLRYTLADQTWRLNTNAPITYVAEETWFTLREPLSFLLGPDESLNGPIDDTARMFEERTTRQWRTWSRRLALPLEWQDAVIRSAITLKLCQFEETGAIVAAMTTSLPEAPHSGRNWDYRYCWLRDAFFVVRALNSLSEVGTMESYMHWLRDIVAQSRNGHIQPLYGIGLEDKLPEEILSHLRGYRGMGPVRVGNQAHEHFQHDVYGNIILGAAQAFHDRRLFRPADATDFDQLQAVGERAWLMHDQVDAGMWELRTRARVHTSSSLMCWAACDRLAKIARVFGREDARTKWRQRADTIKAKILTLAWHPGRQAFVESFGGEHLDASVLLMCEVGLIPADDPRFVSTVKALEAHLCDGPFMRRYEAADDFGKPETAFNVCSFWRIDALARMGRTAQARELFDQLLACRNHVGLMSEDTHPITGEQWGNMPQTYSMVGIINGAVRLSSPWESLI
jgi:GH15 family glucan-1,4-alpha-glucosidase